MPSSTTSATPLTQHLPFALVAVLLGCLWLAGGASRADVIGQVIVRAASWAILIAFVLFGPRPSLIEVRTVAALVFAAVALTALQLVPLPPAAWTELPGREVLTRAVAVLGEEQPWRPVSMSPGATVNALSSLIVPVVALLLAAPLSRSEHWRTATILLGLVVASSLLGLLQFSGSHFDHPLINDVTGSVSGSFANRNHLALFAGIGCILAPSWAFRDGHGARWKPWTALGLTILFLLIILATGSRTGMLVGGLGIVIGLAIVRRPLASALRRLPRRWTVAAITATVGGLVLAIVASIALDRAVSVDRATTTVINDELRIQAFPVIVEMAKLYFPVGSGIGAFDPVYRIHEPSALLNIRYLNHAHNDLLEVVLDAGLPGLLILATAVGWWFWRSATVWLRDAGSDASLARMGSGILLLVLIASVTDYPARTPMIMAVVVIAAIWLGASSVAEHGVNGLTRRSRRAKRRVLQRGERRSETRA